MRRFRRIGTTAANLIVGRRRPVGRLTTHGALFVVPLVIAAVVAALGVREEVDGKGQEARPSVPPAASPTTLASTPPTAGSAGIVDKHPAVPTPEESPPAQGQRSAALTAASAAVQDAAARPAVEAAPSGPPPMAVEAAVVRNAATAPVMAATGDDKYIVQVSAHRTQEEAQMHFQVMQMRYPRMLNGREATFFRKDLGDKGVYWRTQLGPFASRDDAAHLCKDLKAAGGRCIVYRE